MRIYKLLAENINNAQYDVFYGHIVRAESPEQALQMVLDGPYTVADETKAAWRIENVFEVPQDGPAEIIMSDFCAG